MKPPDQRTASLNRIAGRLERLLRLMREDDPRRLKLECRLDALRKASARRAQ